MTSVKAEQLTLQDLDTQFMKTYPEPSRQTKAKTSAASSKHSPKSSKRMLAFLDLRGGGQSAEASSWNTEASHGDFTMLNIGAYHREDGESVCCVTSTDLQHLGFCLTLNLSERPRVANPTLLSEILEEETDPKYNLSSKACRGILNRASKRGKRLPEILEDALKAQIDDEEKVS